MSSRVSGVVFQFNSASALFEFNGAGEAESIGIVDLANLLKDDVSVADLLEVHSSESSLANFLSVGDRVDCDVERCDDLNNFVYTEEEEEIDENGDIKFNSREVCIKPAFKAVKAFLVKGNEASSNEDNVESKKSSKSASIESKCSNGKKRLTKNPNDDDDVVEVAVIANKRSKKMDEDPEGIVDITDNDDDKKESKSIRCRAKLVQLKRPQASRSNCLTRVCSGLMEVIEGKYEGHRALFHTHCIHLFGHHLKEADLLYGLKAGDEFEIDCKDQGTGEETNLAVVEAHLLVSDIGNNNNKTYRDCSAVRPSEDALFASWLASRNMDFSSFQLWLNNSLPPKPYFPLQSEVFQGTILTLLRKEKSSGEGGLVRINDDQWPMDSKLVVFDRSSLYIQGVHVGQTDLRLLLRPGDKLSCQIEEMGSSERRQYKKKLKDYIDTNEECNHVAYLAFVGERKPKSASLSPKESPELKTYLDTVGLTVEEFEGMQRLDSPSKDNKSAPLTCDEKTFEMPSTFFEEITNPFFKDGKTLNTKETITVPVISALQPINSLIARLMMLKSTNDHSEVRKLLLTYEDAQNALYIAKACTAALVSSMQNIIAEKWLTPSKKMEQLAPLSLKETVMRLEASSKFFSKEQTRSGPLPAVQTSTTTKLTSTTTTSKCSTSTENPEDLRSKLELMQKTIDSYDARLNLSKKFTELETRMQSEQLQQRGGSNGRNESRSRSAGKDSTSGRAKQMLQSYVQSSRQNSKGGNGTVSKKDNYNRNTVNPLEQLKLFVSLSRLPHQINNSIHFDSATYPCDIETDFRMHNIGDDRPRYYRLDTLVHFMRHQRLSHEAYIRLAREVRLEAVKKQDRTNLLAYLKSEVSYVPNIDPSVTADVTDKRAVDKIRRGQNKKGFDDTRARKGGSHPPASSLSTTTRQPPIRYQESERAPLTSMPKFAPSDMPAAVPSHSFHETPRPSHEPLGHRPAVGFGQSHGDHQRPLEIQEHSTVNISTSSLPIPVRSGVPPPAPIISSRSSSNRRESRSPSVEMILSDNTNKDNMGDDGGMNSRPAPQPGAVQGFASSFSETRAFW